MSSKSWFCGWSCHLNRGFAVGRVHIKRGFAVGRVHLNRGFAVGRVHLNRGSKTSNFVSTCRNVLVTWGDTFVALGTTGPTISWL